MKKIPWAAQLASLWEDLRGSYWFLPTVMALGAAGLAVVLLWIDALGRPVWADEVSWIYGPEAGSVRTVLGIVAGSMITVTGVVFSITIVALTLASSQFGPRLLRNFMRDTSNQLTMGTFVATFLYCLLVLRALRVDGDAPFVPHLAAAVGVGLGVGSLFVLIHFIHHAARQIQAPNVIEAVANEIDEVLPTLYPEGVGEGQALSREDEARWRERLAEGEPLRALTGGYVRVIDTDGLIEHARERDLVLHLLATPGDFVAEGGVLARVLACGDEPEAEEAEGLAAELRDCFALGAERTSVQDLAFLTDQLSEMAVRALSPGINDPGTAIACLHRLGSALSRLAARQPPAPFRFDEDSRLRILTRARDFEEILEQALGPIRRYGHADADVVASLLGALALCASEARDEERRELAAAAARETAGLFLGSEPPAAERRSVERALRAVTGLP